MINKNDPLIAAVQKVMQSNQAERDAVASVNEKFGVTDRRALPRERQHEWDSAYAKVLTEGVEGSIPKTPKERELAKAHGDPEKITHGDVLKKRGVFEGKKMKDDPCWDTHEMVGMKKGKGGKPVPNCVPVKEQMKDPYGADTTSPSSMGIKPDRPLTAAEKPKSKSVTPADQDALKKKIQGIVKEATEKQRRNKVGDVMGEFKRHKLHSGRGGPIVTSRKQATAIALNVARKLEESQQIDEAGASPAVAAWDKKKNPNKGETLGNIVKPLIPGVDAAIKAKEGDYSGAAKSAAIDVGATLVGGAVGKGILKYGSKALNYLRGGTKAADAAVDAARATTKATKAGTSGVPKIAASGPRGRAPKKGPWGTRPEPAKDLTPGDSRSSFLQKAKDAKAAGTPAPASRPAADLVKGDARSTFLQKAKDARTGGNPTGAPRPAADLAKGDSRSSFLQKAKDGKIAAKPNSVAAKPSLGGAPGATTSIAQKAINIVKNNKMATGAAAGAALGAFGASQTNKPASTQAAQTTPAASAGVSARKIEAPGRKVSASEIMNSSQYKQGVKDVGGEAAARKIQPGTNVAGVGKIEKGETIYGNVEKQLSKTAVKGFEARKGGGGR